MKFTFPKNEKLKSKKRIAQLFEEGKSVSKFPLKLIYLKNAHSTPLKIQTAVSVPKRNFKSAVQRNRIKRLLRESYRLNKQLIFNNIEGDFAFLILYLGKETPSFPAIEKQMIAVFEKFLIQINNEKNN